MTWSNCAAITVSCDRSAIGRKSRTKGAAAEREFCRRVASLTKGRVNLQRNLAQCRDRGDDTGVYHFSIEIKRHRTATDGQIKQWWQQCQANASAQHKVPVLAFRPDQQHWQVVMHPNYFFAEADVRGCVRMDIELFCQYLQDPQAMFGARHAPPA